MSRSVQRWLAEGERMADLAAALGAPALGSLVTRSSLAPTAHPPEAGSLGPFTTYPVTQAREESKFGSKPTEISPVLRNLRRFCQKLLLR